MEQRTNQKNISNINGRQKIKNLNRAFKSSKKNSPQESGQSSHTAIPKSTKVQMHEKMRRQHSPEKCMQMTTAGNNLRLKLIVFHVFTYSSEKIQKTFWKEIQA